MTSKKGLSGIVTMILFVLLILTAIGIIWAFLNPFIQEGAEGIGVAGDCLSLDLNIKSCISSVGYNVSVGRGVDTSNLVKVKLIFIDGDGNAETVDLSATGLEELGSKLYNETMVSLTPVEVGVTGIIGVGDSKSEHICEKISRNVACS